MNQFSWTLFLFLIVALQAIELHGQPVPHGSFRGQNLKIPVHAQGPICTDGTIRSVTQLNSDLNILAGSFTAAGTCTSPNVLVDKSNGKITGDLNSIFNKIKGTVTTSLADGAGGWYIAGSFSEIDGVPRTSLARILANKTLDLTFAPVLAHFYLNPPVVNSLLMKGGYLHIGGDFSSVNGTEQHGIAALDPISGAMNMAFRPVAYGNVSKIEATATELVAAGNFSIAGEVAAVAPMYLKNKTTGAIDNSLLPAALQANNYTVRAIISDGNDGYFIAGDFTNVAGVNKIGIIHLLSNFTIDPAFLPKVVGVSEMMLLNGVLYITGQFNSVNDTRRTFAAGLDVSNGALTAFNPCARSGGALANDGTDIYITGVFRVNGTCSGQNLIADGTTGNPQSFTPLIENRSDSDLYPAEALVRTAVSDGSGGFYVAGDFNYVGGVARKNLAHILSDGTVSAWNPNVTIVPYSWLGSQYAFRRIYYDSASGNVYLIGLFETVNGNPHGSILGFDSSGNMLAVDPRTTGAFTGGMSEIRGMAIIGNTAYVVGCNVNSVNGNSRNQMFAMDKTTGAITSFSTAAMTMTWNGQPSDACLHDVTTDGTNLYVAGYLENVGGSARSGVAAFDTSGSLLAWAPSLSNSGNLSAPRDIVYFSGKIIFSGDFRAVNGSNRYGHAAVGTDGSLTGFFPQLYFDCGGWCYTGSDRLHTDGNKLYISGPFTHAAGSPRPQGVAAYDTSFALTSWQPQITTIYPGAIAYPSGSNTFVTASMDGHGGSARRSLAKFNAAGVAQAFNPNILSASNDPSISDIEFLGGRLYIGGNFDSMDGSGRRALAAYESNGTLSSFNPSIPEYSPGDNSTVSTIFAFNGALYISGHFLNVNGAARNGIAVVNTDGSTNAFNPESTWGISSQFYAKLSDRVVAAKWSSGTRFNFQINTRDSGGTAASYDWKASTASPAHWVWAESLFMADSATHDLFSFGLGADTFVRLTKAVRSGIAAYDSSGAATSFAPQLTQNNGIDLREPYSFALDGNNVYFTGDFDAVNGIARDKAAMVTLSNVLSPWAPSFDIPAASLRVIDGKINVIGSFTTVNGSARSGFARVLTDGTLDALDLSSFIVSLSTFREDANSIYFVGQITDGINPFFGFFKINRASGAFEAFSKAVTGYISDINLENSEILLTGTVSLINPQRRYGLAAIDPNANLVDWVPNLKGQFNVALAHNNILYLAGSDMFSLDDSISYNQAVAVNLDKTMASFDIQLDHAGERIYSMQMAGGLLYLGGDFTRVQGVARKMLAAVNLSGVVQAYNFTTSNSWLGNFLVDGSAVYIVGPNLGITKTNLTGTVDSGFNIVTNGLTTAAIRKIGTNYYVSGEFTHVNSQPRNKVFSFDGSGNVTAWEPDAMFTHTSTGWSSFETHRSMALFGTKLIPAFPVNDPAVVDTVTGVTSSLAAIQYFENTPGAVPFSEFTGFSQNVVFDNSYLCQKVNNYWHCNFAIDRW